MMSCVGHTAHSQDVICDYSGFGSVVWCSWEPNEPMLAVFVLAGSVLAGSVLGSSDLPLRTHLIFKYNPPGGGGG